MAKYEDWFKDTVRRNAQKQAELERQNVYTGEKYGTAIPKPSELNIPALTLEDWRRRALLDQLQRSGAPGPSASAERGRVAARMRVSEPRTAEQIERFPKPPVEELPTDQSGGGGSSLDKVFGPLFDALDQQRRNAESRYTANVGQIQNIYGQLIGARGADINDIQDAYNNLQQAASARGAATLGAMQAREQQRQSQNQAVLQSMGVGDIGSAAMDRAAEASQVAQDVAALGQSNWAGLLGAMGATAQDIARADITGYGYRQGEDIAALQGAKEDYLQNVAQQEFELKSQQALKELEAQQAAAAAAAKAQQDAADAAAKSQQQQYETFLKYSDPLTQSLVAAADMGVLSGAQVAQATDAFNTFMGQVFTAQPPSGMMQWNGASAAAAFRTSPAAEGLNTTQKNLIAEAIRQSF